MAVVNSDAVALVRCEDYQSERVDAALKRALDLIGGLSGIIRPGMRVLIKCNMVMRKGPEAAATTHPEVVRALCTAIKALGAQPIIGDSPGGPLSAALLKSYYAGTGLKEAAERSGAELSLDTQQGFLDCPDGVELKRMDITDMALSADAVISCSKLKTHGMTLMTGCVKNLFGCVPGMTKVEYHARFNQLKRFSNMLIDIERGIRPVLSVLDAIDGMEGEGPTGGVPRHIGALLISRDAHALDATAARIIGLDPHEVCTLARAMERGLLTPDKVEVRGDSINDFIISDYVYPHAARDIKLYSTVPIVGKFINLVTMPHPAYDKARCVRCGICMRSCPAKAIELKPYPKADLSKCIRCFCCQELCPQHAVEVKKSIMRHFIK